MGVLKFCNLFVIIRFEFGTIESEGAFLLEDVQFAFAQVEFPLFQFKGKLFYFDVRNDGPIMFLLYALCADGAVLFFSVDLALFFLCGEICICNSLEHV